MKKLVYVFLCCILVVLNITWVMADDKSGISDGEYMVEVILEGGTGRAGIESPALLTAKDGRYSVRLIWSSSNYDYMLAGGEKYINRAQPGERSLFDIPVEDLGQPFKIIGDTVAMSTPHEIEYTLTVMAPEAVSKEFNPVPVCLVLAVIIGGIFLILSAKQKYFR